MELYIQELRDSQFRRLFLSRSRAWRKSWHFWGQGMGPVIKEKSWHLTFSEYEQEVVSKWDWRPSASASCVLGLDWFEHLSIKPKQISQILSPFFLDFYITFCVCLDPRFESTFAFCVLYFCVFFFFTRFGRMRLLFMYCLMNSNCKCWLFCSKQCIMYCLWIHKFHFLATFSLKMGPTVLFTYLKIILLQWFQQ